MRYLTKKGKPKAFRERCSNLDLKKEGHNLERSKRKTNPQPLIDEKERTITGGKKKAKLLTKCLVTFYLLVIPVVVGPQPYSNITKGYKRRHLVN